MYNELIYYYSLFFIIFILTFVKVKKEGENNEVKFTDYFLFAQEMLYTSAGVVIFLLNKVNFFKEGIIGIYLFLVIGTASIDSLSSEKNRKLKGSYNFGVIISVFVITYIIFSSILPNSDIAKEETVIKKDTTYLYKVVVPYTDNTLIKHIGQQLFNKRKLVFITQVESKNEIDACKQAINKFKVETDFSSPIKPNIIGAITPYIEVDEDNVICKKLNTILKDI